MFNCGTLPYRYLYEPNVDSSIQILILLIKKMPSIRTQNIYIELKKTLQEQNSHSAVIQFGFQNQDNYKQGLFHKFLGFGCHLAKFLPLWQALIFFQLDLTALSLWFQLLYIVIILNVGFQLYICLIDQRTGVVEFYNVVKILW